MKVLLVNPPTINHIKSVLPEVIEEERGFNPPLGLLYLAGYIQKFSPSVNLKISDFQAEKSDYKKIEEVIKKFFPDVIGITVMSFNLIDAYEIAKIAKKINPNIKIAMGGPHVNIFGEETLALGEVDFIVLGEGEKIFNELINNLDDTKKLKTILGLIFRDDANNIINTGLPKLIANLDDIPLPARNLIDNNRYSSILGTSKLVTTMITSRGCPYKCLFCDRPHLGKIFRARSAQSVVEEIEDCLKYGIKEILMYDDTFTINKQRVLDICDLIIQKKLDIKWDIRARVNTVDEEILKKLKKAGCVRIHYGVESGTQKILDTLRKGITLKQIEDAFALTKKIGIETLAYFMIGNPGETKNDIKETIKFAKKINPDYVHITATIPFPATDLYGMALSQKIIKEDIWKKFAENPSANFVPSLWNENLTNDELNKLIKRAYKQFYFRPTYIIKRILALKSLEELKIKVRAGLKMLKI